MTPHSAEQDALIFKRIFPVLQHLGLGIDFTYLISLFMSYLF
jgi:hypothetical protein